MDSANHLYRHVIAYYICYVSFPNLYMIVPGMTFQGVDLSMWSDMILNEVYIPIFLRERVTL